MSETKALAARTYNGVEIPVAGTYVLDANHKRVGFVARHLMVSKVRGQFADATATIVVGEDLGVAHGRFALGVDEVELQLQAGHRPVGIEPEVVEHQREHVEAATDLLAVPRPVLPSERGAGHVFAHGPFRLARGGGVASQRYEGATRRG